MKKILTPLLVFAFTFVFAGAAFAGVERIGNYKNHGEYVKSQEDKDDAAHSCNGMPEDTKAGFCEEE